MGKHSDNLKEMPSWFTPELYEYEDTPEHWLAEIERRLHVKSVIEVLDDRERAAELFLKIVVLREDDSDHFGKLETDVRWPVGKLSVFEATYLSQLWSNDEPEKRVIEFATQCTVNPASAVCKNTDKLESSDLNDTDVLKDLGSDAHLQRDILKWRVPLSVDIRLDDDILKFAFSVWLTGIRGALGDPKYKRREIRNKDLQHWCRQD